MVFPFIVLALIRLIFVAFFLLELQFLQNNSNLLWRQVLILQFLSDLFSINYPFALAVLRTTFLEEFFQHQQSIRNYFRLTLAFT